MDETLAVKVHCKGALAVQETEFGTGFDIDEVIYPP